MKIQFEIFHYSKSNLVLLFQLKFCFQQVLLKHLQGSLNYVRTVRLECGYKSGSQTLTVPQRRPQRTMSQNRVWMP